MSTASVAIVDTLVSLFEAERASVFRLMGEGSPFVTNAPPRVRETLLAMKEANVRHVAALAGAIRTLDGPPPRPDVPPEPYLNYLSLKFLLPKLADEKELLIQRYENALRAMPEDAPREVVDLLRSQDAEHKRDVETLRAAAEHVLANPA